VKKETFPSKLQTPKKKKKKKKLEIGAVSAVTGFRERRILSLAAETVFDQRQRLALGGGGGGIPVPLYFSTAERNIQASHSSYSPHPDTNRSGNGIRRQIRTLAESSKEGQKTGKSQIERRVEEKEENASSSRQKIMHHTVGSPKMSHSSRRC